MRTLTADEVGAVSGGEANWAQVETGVAMIGVDATILALTGLAPVTVGVLGAATMFELGAIGVAYGFAGAGGYFAMGGFLGGSEG